MNQNQESELIKECKKAYNTRKQNEQETEKKAADEFLPEAIKALKLVLSISGVTPEAPIRPYAGEIKTLNSSPNTVDLEAGGIIFRATASDPLCEELPPSIAVARQCTRCYKDYFTPVFNRADIGQAITPTTKHNCGVVKSTAERLEKLIREIAGEEGHK
jgi:hypothetical protein